MILQQELQPGADALVTTLVGRFIMKIVLHKSEFRRVQVDHRAFGKLLWNFRFRRAARPRGSS